MPRKSLTSARNHYAIPYYLRSEGVVLVSQFVDTPVGPVQRDVMKRIDDKDFHETLNYEMAAAELRVAADYIDHLAKLHYEQEIEYPKTEQQKQAKLVLEKAHAAVEQVEDHGVVGKTTVKKVAVQHKTEFVITEEQTKEHKKSLVAKAMAEYVKTGDVTIITDNGKLSQEQREKFKRVTMAEIFSVRGRTFSALKMSNGKPTKAIVIAPGVELVAGKRYALVENEDSVITDAILLPDHDASELSKTFNSLFRV